MREYGFSLTRILPYNHRTYDKRRPRLKPWQPPVLIEQSSKDFHPELHWTDYDVEWKIGWEYQRGIP